MTSESHSGEQVAAALAAENRYIGERASAMRDASRERYGHAGAYVAAEAPDDVERVARMLAAAAQVSPMVGLSSRRRRGGRATGLGVEVARGAGAGALVGAVIVVARVVFL